MAPCTQNVWPCGAINIISFTLYIAAQDAIELELKDLRLVNYCDFTLMATCFIIEGLESNFYLVCRKLN